VSSASGAVFQVHRGRRRSPCVAYTTLRAASVAPSAATAVLLALLAAQLHQPCPPRPQIDYGSRSLDAIYQLHDGPINVLLLADGLVLTGGDDARLRVWPLDFRDYLLEVCCAASNE
jgi:hypothetical protein